MQYSQFEFFTRNQIERDWLISILSDFHFEGFEETSDSLKGFVYADKMSSDRVAEILSQNEFTHLNFLLRKLKTKTGMKNGRKILNLWWLQIE